MSASTSQMWAAVRPRPLAVGQELNPSWDTGTESVRIAADVWTSPPFRGRAEAACAGMA
jgi:hypothetical protein